MKLKLHRSLGTTLIERLKLPGSAADYQEGKTVTLEGDVADELIARKLASPAESKTITAPAKAPAIEGK